MRERVTRLLVAMRSSPVVTTAMLLGIGLAARVAWMQLSSLDLPIFGADGHHWRQSFTFGVAWNYAHTALDVLRPRMFTELQRSNIVAMEPPVYPLLASMLLRVGGDSVVGPRLVSWLSLVATVWVLVRLLGLGRTDVRDVRADRAALLVALSVSAMTLTDFRSVQPEPMAAGLAMIAAWCFVRYRVSERTSDALLGAVFTTLAVLTKPVVLGIVPGLALFAVWGPGRWWRRGVIVAGALLPGLALYAVWDRWAAYLLRTEMDGLIVISIQHDTAEMLRNLKNAGYTREALFHFVPNYAGSWWLAPALVAGFFRGLADRRLRPLSVPFGVWLAGYVFELVAFGDRLHSNAYYFILAPAPVAFFSALGLGGLFRTLESPAERPPLLAHRVGLAVAVLLPLGRVLAKPSSWSSIAPSDLGFAHHRGIWTDDLGLGRILIVVLVAIAVGPRLRPRRVPAWLGLTVMLGVLLSGVWALRDADQYFRFYAAIGKRGDFSSELAGLRAAVDRYSHVEDRIVTNDDTSLHCYYALRNCFAASEARTRDTLAAVRARGARLYVHVDSFEGSTTAAQIGGEPLERGRWWRVYCIDERGCTARRGSDRVARHGLSPSDEGK